VPRHIPWLVYADWRVRPLNWYSGHDSRLMNHVQTSHTTRTNEWCHTYNLHIQTSHDTYQLQHPEEMRKVQLEIDRVLGTGADRRQPMLDDIRNLSYTRLALAGETFRKSWKSSFYVFEHSELCEQIFQKCYHRAVPTLDDIYTMNHTHFVVCSRLVSDI